MLTDPTSVAGLVTREIRSGERDGAPIRVAVARRTYPTGREDLWDCLTNVERIPRWFLPVSGDLVEGGSYQLEGNAGGRIERCAAPESFAVTWEYGGMVSWLTVSLTPVGDGTTLELVHEAAVDPEMWKQFGPGAVGLGWDLALVGLGMHLESGRPVDPEVATGFTFSPEGRDYLRVAAAGWADAAVADGDEREAADQAAATTFDAYTTPPEQPDDQPQG
jgi:uncharacterized protein YndB with AHSA1/START domain